MVGREGAAHDANDAPKEKCRCGVYASKSLEHLHVTGYERYGICGEVNLWGTVVEHEQGFRAQFAYPKSLYLPPKMLRSTLAEIQSRLQALTLYGSDIFIFGDSETISLWDKDSGYSPAGLDYLIERSKQDHDRRQRDRTLEKGDRVAILGRGIAVVEHIDSKWIQAVVWNKTSLRIARKEIVWDERNARWETDANAAFECLVQPML
jgi:preprotein translocase subunit YajC